MKILLVSQYFYPENFKINDLVFTLKERGHEITVLTGKPNYPKGKFFDGYSWNSPDFETINGVSVFRSNLFSRGNGGAILLFLNYLSFALLASLKLKKIKGSFDAIFVYQTSPVTVGIPAFFAKLLFKVPIYFWVQDLWPESLTAAGGIKNKFILGVFNSLTKWIYKHSKKILIQSVGFREYIQNQGVPNDKIIFYPNLTENFYTPLKEVVEYKEDWKEIKTDRTLTSAFFKNSKGDIRAEYASKAIHYYDNGILKRIHSKLKKVSKGYVADQQPYPTYLNSDGSLSLSIDQNNNKLTIGKHASIFNQISDGQFDLQNNIAYYDSYFRQYH